jgi:hypothetical protein
VSADERLASVVEQHYTPKQLASRLGKSDDWVREEFENEKGVLKAGVSHRRGKRRYVTLMIPESVVLRVLKRMEV